MAAPNVIKDCKIFTRFAYLIKSMNKSFTAPKLCISADCVTDHTMGYEMIGLQNLQCINLCRES